MREILVKNEEFKDSPVGRIPQDWSHEKLQRLCKTPIRDFGSFSMTNLINFLDSGIPFLKSEMIEEENLNTKNLTFISNQVHKLLKKSWVYPGNILYSKIGSALGKAVLYKGNLGVCNSNAAIAKIDIDEAIALPAYVVRVLNSQEGKQRLTKSIISLLPRINLTDLYNFDLPLPPREEQNKIAEILDTVDEAIARTSSLIIKLKQTKAGLLQDLLTRGLDEDGKLRDPQAHPEQFKDSPLGLIPKEWDLQTLSSFSIQEVNGFVNGPFGSDLLASELRKEGIPVIYVRDIKPGLYNRVSTVHVSDEKARDLSFCNVKYGDVLVAKVGDPPCDSAPYLLSSTSIVTQDVIRIRPRNDTNTYFLSSLINSEIARKTVELITIAGTRKRVSLTEFKCIQLPKPPYKEQCEISSILNSHDTRIRKEEAYLNKLKLQKQGLMQDLLTGKVRVRTIK
ncbi:MAG: restriction endonuclease subunit S [Nostoc sp. SerVER01]|nr:restriction endonuclease subunit S [Nostoc sp. SerVER01]